jgi:hypothetical protein
MPMAYNSRLESDSTSPFTPHSKLRIEPHYGERIVRNPLPIMHAGVVPIEPSRNPIIPPYHVPIVTMTLHNAENAYRLSAYDLQGLIDRDFLTCHGSPTNPSTCLDDLESAARAWALLNRGGNRSWGHCRTTYRIRSSCGDRPHLRRLLARFLLGHLRSRPDHQDIVAYRNLHQGLDIGSWNVHPIKEKMALRDFAAGL